MVTLRNAFALDHPAFDTLRDVIARCPAPRDGASDWIDALNREATTRAVFSSGGSPLQFTAAVGTLGAAHYEQAIATTGRVYTRTGGDEAWHDYFNALAWLAYPLTKAELNRAQVAAITTLAATDPSSRRGSRGAVRDRLTLIDEGAAIVVSRDPACARALRRHDWVGAFVAGRDDWRRSVDVWVFGHALLQKLLAPYKALCAHAWLYEIEPPNVTDDAAHGSDFAPPRDFDALRARRDEVDRCFAQAIGSGVARRSAAHADGTLELPLTPLPLLGVPGWCPDNEDPAFYQDRRVFRPARMQPGRR